MGYTLSKNIIEVACFEEKAKQHVKNFLENSKLQLNSLRG
jgi:hypothetical protein